MTSANEYSRDRSSAQHNQRAARPRREQAGDSLPNASTLARLKRYKTTHDLNWDTVATLCGVSRRSLFAAYRAGTIGDRLAARIERKLDVLEGGGKVGAGRA